MEDSFFQNYSRKHIHFYEEAFPALLELGFTMIVSVEKPCIADLGCGDGRLLFALHKKGLLNSCGLITGVDISPKRIERLKSELPFVKGVVSDASSVEMYSSCYFDYIICSQVIEHVKDDRVLVAEIKRLLKSGGLAFISSVTKHWYGLYLYKNAGKYRLDPTHVREYASADEFVDLMKTSGFKVFFVKTRQVTFPISDLVLRLCVRLGLMKPDACFYQKHKLLGKMRRLRLPIIGYKDIAVLVKKNE
jgi:2-polyprenyl-3-methyl-5-hydroxy-6-metoxy-1,4-benzoquinol methylase